MGDLSQILNVSLYRALMKRFGDVRVVAMGQAILWKVVPIHTSDGVRPSRKVLASGEEYVVRCPFCRDHKPRLYINHLWGRIDYDTGYKNLWLAQCFNEECLTSLENQKRLYFEIYEKGGASSESVIKEGTRSEPAKLCEMPPPGLVIDLETLTRHTPNHHVLQYLEARYFDPLKLHRYYHVGYVAESRYTQALDRIYIPILHRGKLVGWQARYPGDTVQGRSFKEMGVAKYFTCPNMCRKLIAYNMERAMKHPTIVIVEGPTDVWNFGSQAMALLSKKMNPILVKEVGERMKQRWGKDAVIVVMLDPEWDEQARKKGRHPIMEVADQFSRRDLPVVPVWLPEGTDPGNLDRQTAKHLAVETGRKIGVRNVTFKVRAKI